MNQINKTTEAYGFIGMTMKSTEAAQGKEKR